MKKIISITLCFVLLMSLFILPVSAQSFTTNTDISPTSTQSINLTSILLNEGVTNYVVFSPSDYDYYIVYGDELVYDSVSRRFESNEEVSFVRYHRVSSGSYSYDYVYDWGKFNNFSLNASNDMCVSNLGMFGAYEIKVTNNTTYVLYASLIALFFMIVYFFNRFKIRGSIL